MLQCLWSDQQQTVDKLKTSYTKTENDNEKMEEYFHKAERTIRELKGELEPTEHEVEVTLEEDTAPLEEPEEETNTEESSPDIPEQETGEEGQGTAEGYQDENFQAQAKVSHFLTAPPPPPSPYTT